MVTAAATKQIIVNKIPYASNQPIMCLNGLFFACQYKNDHIFPSHETSIDALIEFVSAKLLESKSKEEKTSMITRSLSVDEDPTPKSLIEDEHVLLSLNRSRSQTVMFTKNSERKNSIRRRLFSDPSQNGPIANQNVIDPNLTSFLIPLTRKTYNDSNDNLLHDIDSTVSTKHTKQIEWAERYCNDYINTENLSNISELYIILNVLKKCNTAIILSLKLNLKNEISLTYQFLKSFKNNYMIAPVNKDYCMIMKAF